MKMMKKVLVIAFFVLFSFAYLYAIDDSAKVSSFSGKVEIKKARDSKWREVKVGAVVNKTYQLRLAKKSWVELTWPDGVIQKCSTAGVVMWAKLVEEKPKEKKVNVNKGSSVIGVRGASKELP